MWDGLSKRLTDRWVALWTPGFLFWACGFLAWIQSGEGSWRSLTVISTWSGLVQAVAGTALLALIALSALLVQRLTVPLLRMYEGYWPRWFVPTLRRRMVARQQKRAKQLEDRFQELEAALERDPESAELVMELNRLEDQQKRFPVGPSRCMPTRLGNILRASESRPIDKYGLDPVRCWSRLWLVLPDSVRQEASESRTMIDVAVGTQVWGFGLLVWTPWAWWAAPLGLAVALLSWPWLSATCERFGEVLEAVFDLYRFRLYEAVHWEMPDSTGDERKLGRALTTYLWTGDDLRRS